jgi:hypothetical protein
MIGSFQTPRSNQLLALLEEAGEDDLLTLVNTVVKGHFSTEKLQEITNSFSELYALGFIGFGQKFNAETGEWTLLPDSVVRSLLSRLPNLVQWSQEERYWKWPKREQIVFAVLTKIGALKAKEILAQEGWKIRGGS